MTSPASLEYGQCYHIYSRGNNCEDLFYEERNYHRNPQKHGFLADFRDWTYSSYNTILSQKPTLLKRDEVLGVGWTVRTRAAHSAG